MPPCADASTCQHKRVRNQRSISPLSSFSRFSVVHTLDKLFLQANIRKLQSLKLARGCCLSSMYLSSLSLRRSEKTNAQWHPARSPWICIGKRYYSALTARDRPHMVWRLHDKIYSDFTQRLLRLHLGYDRNLKGHFGLTYSSLWLREP